IFPVEARAGGVLVKHGLVEGALDLVKASGFTEAALFSDLLNEQGEFMSEEEWRRAAEAEKLPIFGLGQLVRHRLENETLVQRVAEARLPTSVAGELRSCIYKSSVHNGEHLALIK